MVKRYRTQSWYQNPLVQQYAWRAGQYVARQAGRYVRRRLNDAVGGYGPVRKSRLPGNRGRPIPVRPPPRPRPPTPAPRPRPVRRGGARRTRGIRGPRFGNKVSSRSNEFLKRGVVWKREFGATVSDADAVYVGHSTTPARQTIQVVVFAIARMFAAKFGENFTSFDTQLQGDQPSAGSSGYLWKITYRTASGGPVLLTTTSSATGDTWGGFAERLLTLMLFTMNNGGVPFTYFEIVDIGFADVVGATTSNIQVYSADAIMLNLVGNSNMLLQNRTLATNTVGDGDNDQKDHISNNPLIGKMYKAYGTSFPYKFNNDFVGPTPMFQTDQDQGAMSIGLSTTLADLPATMRDVLRKPPPYNVWHHVTGNSYERMAPGQIRRSKVMSVHKMSFATFIKKYFNYMRSAANLPGLIQDQAHMAKIGKTVFFGFEKLLNSRVDEPAVSIGWEINLTMSCVATARRKMFCAPIVDVI